MVLAMYDFDRFGKHDIIGKIEIPMNSIDLGQVYEATKELEAADKVCKILIIESLTKINRIAKNWVTFASRCAMCRPVANSTW